MKRKVYEALANRVQAYHSCLTNGNLEWADKHEEVILDLVENYLPRGGGFDVGTCIVLEKSDGRRVLRLDTSFHKLNNMGYYDGWYDYTVKVVADMIGGIDVNARGRNVDGLRDYVEETFYEALQQEVDD